VRTKGGAGRRGSFFVTIFAIALIFTGFGFILSYGIGSHNETSARQDDPTVGRFLSPGRSELPLTESGESPFVAVVDKSYDAVVNITSTRTYRSRYNDMYDDFWRRFFGLQNRPQVIPSFGSGFVISEDGLIVTNNHVVEGSENVTVTMADKTTYKATVVGTDPATDIAVLKIDPKDELPKVLFGKSDEMKIGDWVIAIGNPFPTLGLDRTVTVGVISGKGRSPMNMGGSGPIYQDYIQTDASINPGNSGGPLLNLYGEVIGVNSAIASPSGGSVGIGFAIPSDLAADIVNEIITEGTVRRGWLGIYLRDVTADEAEMVGLEKPMGILVEEVTPGSPAEQSGLQRDDVVVTFEGEAIKGSNDFRLKVAAAHEGERVSMGVIRRGQPKEVDVVLGDREQALAQMNPSQTEPQTPEQMPEEHARVSAEWLGIRVADATPDLAERFGVDYHDGVIVVSVEQGSPADIKGIVPGTIIVEINYVKISGREDFEKVASELNNRKRAIAFHVFDTSGRIGYVAIKPR